MIPIHELLNRIRWDKEYGQGQFEIGYWDRVEGTIHRLAFQEIHIPGGQHQVFEVVDETGQRQSIPFHRVREVYKDGQLIWKRGG